MNITLPRHLLRSLSALTAGAFTQAPTEPVRPRGVGLAPSWAFYLAGLVVGTVLTTLFFVFTFRLL